jgi:hypothetical protein
MYFLFSFSCGAYCSVIILGTYKNNTDDDGGCGGGGGSGSVGGSNICSLET